MKGPFTPLRTSVAGTKRQILTTSCFHSWQNLVDEYQNMNAMGFQTSIFNLPFISS